MAIALLKKLPKKTKQVETRHVKGVRGSQPVYEEPKASRTLRTTQLAWDGLTGIASPLEISRNELIERIGRESLKVLELSDEAWEGLGAIASPLALSRSQFIEKIGRRELKAFDVLARVSDEAWEGLDAIASPLEISRNELVERISTGELRVVKGEILEAIAAAAEAGDMEAIARLVKELG